MNTGFSGGWYDNQPPRPTPKKDPWYESPFVYIWGMTTFVIVIILLSMGLLIQGMAAIFCLAIIFGKITITELHTLKDVHDPFTH
jgi:hypothetical protein